MDNNPVTSSWNGFKRLDFTLNGRDCILVIPDRPVSGNKWVWRAEFFDAFPSADLAMVREGWHLAYYRVSNMYGNPESIALMKQFHDFLTGRFGLSKTAVLFGFSRGGLYAVNYAVKYPEDTGALYLDAPWLDIRGWPSEKGHESPQEWEDCKRAYGLTDEEMQHFADNPINKAPVLAKAGIPLILVAGGADVIVPFAKNGQIFAENYKKAGGKVSVIVKPGVGHHPHSLDDPKPIVDFLLENAR